MNIQQITNPLNAFYAQATSDYRTGVDTAGQLLGYGQICVPFRANATITAGQLLAFVVPTAAVPLSVKPRATTDLMALTIGLAQNAASAGGVVQVCIMGHSLAAVFSSTTVAIGEYAIHDTTNAGVLQRTATEIAATGLNGDLLGTFLGAKNASNIAPIWFNQR